MIQDSSCKTKCVPISPQNTNEISIENTSFSFELRRHDRPMNMRININQQYMRIETHHNGCITCRPISDIVSKETINFKFLLCTCHDPWVHWTIPTSALGGFTFQRMKFIRINKDQSQPLAPYPTLPPPPLYSPLPYLLLKVGPSMFA